VAVVLVENTPVPGSVMGGEMDVSQEQRIWQLRVLLIGFMFGQDGAQFSS
jgi:hypothetical protein